MVSGSAPSSELDSSSQDWLHRHPGWRIEGRHLCAAWKFPDFLSALQFVQTIGHLAELQSHHPDLELGYGYVRLKLTTHDGPGLSSKDFALASQIHEEGAPTS